MEEQKAEQSKLETWDSEVENGIFNLVITLCQQKAVRMGDKQAKNEVSQWLSKMATALESN